MTKKQLSYKESLEELEGLIEKIENGEPDVDELSSLVKRASELIKSCKQKLRSTENDLNQFFEGTED